MRYRLCMSDEFKFSLVLGVVVRPGQDELGRGRARAHEDPFQGQEDRRNLLETRPRLWPRPRLRVQDVPVSGQDDRGRRVVRRSCGGEHRERRRGSPRARESNLLRRTGGASPDQRSLAQVRRITGAGNIFWPHPGL